MIVLLHFLILDAYPQIWSPIDYSTGIVAASILNGFLYVAVNCYILISGYFGVRFKWQSLLKVYGICFFYGIAAYLIHIGISGDQIGRSLLYNSIFCISHSKLWYVRCYIILLLISPILNTAIESFTKRQFQYIVLSLTILNLYFGYFWQSDNFNKDGYNIEQFIYLYFIGRYIRLYCDHAAIHQHRIHYLVGYIICALIWGGATILWHKISLPIWEPFAYNNPITIIGALCFVCFFLTFHFQSNIINKLATFTFPIYVVHTGNYFSSWINDFIQKVSQYTDSQYGIICTLLTICSLAIATMIFISVIDCLRQKILRLFSFIRIKTLF